LTLSRCRFAGWRCWPLGDPRLADRDRQTQRRRSSSLPGRRHQPHRPGPSEQRPRRAAALGLSARSRSRGL